MTSSATGRSPNGRSIAVVSDIHGNSCALKSFISEIRNRKIPNILVLGDLLTYGCDPNGVIELLNELQHERRCIFVKGNHDQFYFDLSDGMDPFSYETPDFVKESVNWTFNNFNYDLGTEFEWLNQYCESGCFFAHANPFEYGDWRYINSADDHRVAAEVLADLKHNIAFFGHTHRRKVGVCSGSQNPEGNRVAFADCQKKNFSIEINQTSNVSIFNTGSVGQSRGTPPSFFLVNVADQHVEVDVIDIDFNISKHVEQIQQSGMSAITVDQLCSYFIKSVK